MKMSRLVKFYGRTGIVISFLLIVYIPLLLVICSWASNRKFDIPLKGYTDIGERTELTWQNLCSGDFQKGYVNWLDSNIKPRGVLIHLYKTFRYNVFNQASRPILDNGDLISPAYLQEKYCIGTNYDYSISENKSKMDDYVRELNEIQQKLLRHGKYLFIYIAPSKADWDYASVPSKYVNMKGCDSVRMYDYFKTSISKTDITFMDCDDLYSVLEYPAFYSTGIHWSRTFEQEASAQIIEKLSALTGNKYRKILLGDVQKSREPFWRDSDIFDNENLWNQRNETYYEYEAVREQDDFNKMRVLLYGDSFGEGLVKDIVSRYPFEDVFYINYNNFITTRNAEKKTMLNQNWSNMDFAYYLDRSDVIIIEMTKPCIGQYSCGFTTALNAALDSYVEGTTFRGHLTELDPSDEAASWNSEDVLGLYAREDGFVWANKDSQIVLDSECIKNEGGVEIDYSTPGQLQRQTVTIWINGKLVSERTYEQGTEEKIVILAKQLPDDINGAFEIEITCSDSFNPFLLGQSSDNRNLAMYIRYIGEVR